MIKEYVYPCKKRDCVHYGEWIAVKSDYPMILSRKLMWKKSKSWWKRFISDRGYLGGYHYCPMCKHFEPFDLFIAKENASALDTND